MHKLSLANVKPLQPPVRRISNTLDASYQLAEGTVLESRAAHAFACHVLHTLLAEVTAHFPSP